MSKEQATPVEIPSPDTWNIRVNNAVACDWIIRGGHVIDPALGLDCVCDIAVRQGKIIFVGQNCTLSAHNELDATGQFVVPGLIDAHAHFYPEAHAGLHPDTAGVYSGVTTNIDGGSSGSMTFADFRTRHLDCSITDSYAFLHLNPIGQFTIPELWDPKKISVDPECVVDTIMENRDRIVGLKVRALGSMIEAAGFEPFVAGKKICERCNIPYVVHFGLDSADTMSDESVDAFTADLLPLLDKGDCITHAFSGKRGKLFHEDGRFLPAIQAAVKRGVLLDACLGRTNFSVKSFELALAAGFKPDIISTDMTRFGMQSVGMSFANSLSKFLALGLSLPEIIAMATINPARAYFPDGQKGSLHVGSVADITVLAVQNGDFTFLESTGGATFSGTQRIVPGKVFRKGALYSVTHA